MNTDSVNMEWWLYGLCGPVDW